MTGNFDFMLLPIPFLSIRFLFCFWLVPHGSALANEEGFPRVVQIETGLLEGVANQEKSVTCFKGIPYAQPPVGDLRWREPKPPQAWEGVRKATAFGASCPQIPSTFTPPYTAEFAVTNAMSEDCLFLNVWTPAQSDSEKLAVLVYLHGGSGTRGSGSIPLYDGESLAKKGIIVVTINFRLGLFAGMGHPELSKESPHGVCGNYGMLDMIAALTWVKQNIAAFGGDPAKVTVCGQSSGCMALHYLTISPLAKGLFRSAIAVSFPYDYVTKPHSVGNVWQKEQHGLQFAAAKKAESIAALRKIPAMDLIAPDPAVESFTRAVLESSMNTDGWCFPVDYPKALEQGLVADIPVLTGITSDDFGPPAAFLKTTASTFAQEIKAVFGTKAEAFSLAKEEFLDLCPVTSDQDARTMLKRTQVEYRSASVFHWAQSRGKTAKSPVYGYVFTQAIPWPERPNFGAFHSSDLVYSFNNLDQMERPWKGQDKAVAEEVSSYWVNFVKSGDPNGDGLPMWKPLSPRAAEVMMLGAESVLRPVADEFRMAFYLKLFQK
jgi:para-nitrobenzyl esterase